MNDPTLTASISVVIQHARRLNELVRDNRLLELRGVLQEIQDAALRGGYRCNDIVYKRTDA